METDSTRPEIEENFAIDEEKFVQSALIFPCFEDAKESRQSTSKTYEIIMKAYQSDDLTEEQDLVVELLFHMQHEGTPFNLKRATALWSEEDIAVLWEVLMAANEDSITE